MTKYRIAFCISPDFNLSHFLDHVLSEDEAATWVKTRATCIFYTASPDQWLLNALEEGFEFADFNWINISKE